MNRKVNENLCPFQQLPVKIVDIKSMGQRIIVSDSQESVHFMLYKRAENQLIVFADETTPRYIVSVCFVDYDTVAVGDRFGNISIVSHSPMCSRLPGTNICSF